MTWDAAQYDSNFSFVTDFGRGVLGQLDARPGERVLDLGCGTGDLAAEIAASGAEVHGIDSDAAMIRAAIDKYASDAEGPTFAVTDGHAFAVDEPFELTSRRDPADRTKLRSSGEAPTRAPIVSTKDGTGRSIGRLKG